jgi:hypothetical protein
MFLRVPGADSQTSARAGTRGGYGSVAWLVKTVNSQNWPVRLACSPQASEEQCCSASHWNEGKEEAQGPQPSAMHLTYLSVYSAESCLRLIFIRSS